MKKAIAIRLINSRSLFLGLLIFTLGIQQVSAQILGSRTRSSALPETSFSYADPKEYTIADIQVTGSQFYDGTSMINISGLQVGDVIKVPGDAIASAIRKIMNQDILDEVLIYATKAEVNKLEAEHEEEMKRIEQRFENWMEQEAAQHRESMEKLEEAIGKFGDWQLTIERALGHVEVKADKKH